MRVFVSSQAVDRPPASLLIARLRAEGCSVAHSPSNPLDADDPRWTHWYDRGLASALADVDVFIAVIDEGWDSSTWMAVEADTAQRTRARPRRCYAWNPQEVRVLAAGMQPYLGGLLPSGLDAAIGVIKGGSAGPRPEADA